MIYRDFKNIKLSALGLGCMRFPKCGENESDIDIAATKEMVDYALKNGINYFDTAWGYHGGKSEIVIGELLKEYPRKSFYLASKFPGFSKDVFERKEEIFNKQLEKCQVDYFDFYLLHCVSEESIDWYTSDEYGLLDYLIEQKKNGKIHHLGFSAHCNLDTFKRLLAYYGEHIEFCQLQINWLDWDYQDAKTKVQILTELNIPVWVMEPLRGGKLADLKPVFKERLKPLNPNMTDVEWAFRFLQSIPQITMTLSGMSTMQQLKQNINIFSESKPLNQTEIDTLFKIGSDMMHKDALPCTACGYCLEKCPMGLNIPLFTESYNEYIYANDDYTLPTAVKELSDDKLPSACIGCGACESVCPQNIKISQMMTAFSEKILK